MNTKHTPGPWMYSEKEDIVHAVNGKIVAEMCITTSSDARLIAAAPEMYDLLLWVAGMSATDPIAVARIEALITKVGGM